MKSPPMRCAALKAALIVRLVGLLLLDFLYWLQHLLHHKVPLLWSFHVVHHSQREMNFFTDYRYHVVEYVVRHTILVIPFLILDVNTPTVVWIAIFQSWFTRFYHGNIRTNLGPLRWVLVTPQSHRVHHSIETRHRDLNFHHWRARGAAARAARLPPPDPVPRGVWHGPPTGELSRDDRAVPGRCGTVGR